MESIFTLVLETSIYGSIVAVFIMVLKSILKYKISPKWHYIIWIVLIVKLIVPFGPSSHISIFNVIQTKTENYKPEDTTYTSLNMEDKNQGKTIPSLQYTNENSTVKENEQSRKKKTVIKNYFFYIWIAGEVIMFTYIIYTNYILTRKLKDKMIMNGREINLIFNECKIKMGVKRDIEIVLQNITKMPVLFGLLKPKILISRDTLNLSTKQISYILMHELAHYKRKDILINYILIILQMVHWFNPIIWYSFIKIREDMELAADEKVLEVLQYEEHKEYGKTLLVMLEKINSPKVEPKLIGMVDNKKSIERRIKMIKMANFFKSKRRIIFATGILCIILSGAVLLTSEVKKVDSIPNSALNSEPYNVEEASKFKIVLNPQKYSLIMSNTPGICVLPQYEDKTVKVRYSTEKGIFLDWDQNTWKINEHGRNIEMPCSTPIYWSADNEAFNKDDKVIIKIELLDKNNKLIAENQAEIQYDGSYFICISDEDEGEIKDIKYEDLVTKADVIKKATLDRLDQNGRAIGGEGIQGSGVDIRLSPINNSAEDSKNIKKVSDKDLIYIINKLTFAGAEAISVNNIRISSRSIIEMSEDGEYMIINGEKFSLSKEFSIKAVGDKFVLSNAVEEMNFRIDLTDRFNLNIGIGTNSIKINKLIEK